MRFAKYSKMGGFRQNAFWQNAFWQIFKIERLSPKCVLTNIQNWEAFAKMRFDKYSKLEGFRQNAF